MDELDIQELKDEAICWKCIGESYLSKKAKKEGETHTCRYCSETRKAITLEELASIIETAFDQHYTLTPTDMDGFEYAMHKDPEIDYEWERKGEPTAYAIMNAAEIEERAAQDVQRILADQHEDFESAQMGEEAPFAEDAHYDEIMPDGIEWHESWRSFERSLKSEARFFSRTAAEHLASLFDDLDNMRTQNGQPLIVEAGPNASLDHLYRARVFQSDQALCRALERPDLELAAPPSALAPAGRMNAKGISTFYGATKEEIAIAEVRPPVGSQVAVARFDLTRPLRLLDLDAMTKIHETGSIFDPSYARRLGRMMFLKSLCQRMARAVMPDDQDFEYLPTQAIADYLATEAKTPLDGILFPSVQAGGQGLNAVLFHKASRCLALPLPNGTRLSSHTGYYTDNDWETDYMVFEKIPPAVRKPEKPDKSPFPLAIDIPAERGAVDNDTRQPSLMVATNSIQVHVINAVAFNASVHGVKRLQTEQRDDEF